MRGAIFLKKENKFSIIIDETADIDNNGTVAKFYDKVSKNM